MRVNVFVFRNKSQAFFEYSLRDLPVSVVLFIRVGDELGSSEGYVQRR